MCILGPFIKFQFSRPECCCSGMRLSPAEGIGVRVGLFFIVRLDCTSVLHMHIVHILLKENVDILLVSMLK
jgi:hypothetical protein